MGRLSSAVVLLLFGTEKGVSGSGEPGIEIGLLPGPEDQAEAAQGEEQGQDGGDEAGGPEPVVPRVLPGQKQAAGEKGRPREDKDDAGRQVFLFHGRTSAGKGGKKEGGGAPPSCRSTAFTAWGFRTGRENS